MDSQDLIKLSAEIISKNKYAAAFTGAGISVESGIPPFRGPGGIWNKYNPQYLDIDFYYAEPASSWDVIKQMFFSKFLNSEPNEAHTFLAVLEKNQYLDCVITQNIDSLHHKAGSSNVIEFHGNSSQMVCTICGHTQPISTEILSSTIPECERCSSLLKPDFTFFGEAIKSAVHNAAFQSISNANVLLVIGTTGEVFPAAALVHEAKNKKIPIIEINVEPSAFTHSTSDYFLRGKASEICLAISKHMNIDLK